MKLARPSKQKKVVACKTCGKEFQILLSRYIRCKSYHCSKECHNNAMRTGILRTCTNCGKEYYLSHGLIEKGVGKGCSYKCTMILLRKELSTTHNCEYCDKEYTTLISRIDKGRDRFCSKKCFYASREISEACICQYCGKTFHVQPWRLPMAYCSKNCYGKAVSGINSPQWKGGISFKPYCIKFNKEFKEYIREKFNRTCFLCSSVENGQKLAVHHIDYNKNSICNGKEWAFLPLCISDHIRTNTHRWYWFNLLINYWSMNPEINFEVGFIWGFNGMIANLKNQS
jgi:hypothetical protein